VTGRAPAPSTASTRVDGLDVVRGIAIGLVLLRHAWPSVFRGSGVTGVVVFFALSGYLITGVLVRELRATGTIGFRRFYARRVRRLAPALVAMTAVFALVTLTVDPLGERPELVRTIAVALTYTADLPFHHGSAAMFHLWTLGVEEQFYLVWPALLLIAWMRRFVAVAVVLATAASFSACAATLAWASPDVELAYPLPTTWAVCLLLGAATRLALEKLPAEAMAGGPSDLAHRASMAAIAAIVLLSVVPLRGHAVSYLLGGPLIAALACVLLVAWRSWHVVRPRLLRPLVALGTISYGVYLWNYPITLWLRPSMGAWAGAAGLALSIPAAALSWHIVAPPILDRGRPSARSTARIRAAA
jgi:peptidoglycan/LPS O-acetylase OafA/YrhL